MSWLLANRWRVIVRITPLHPAARPGGVSSRVSLQSSLSVESAAKALSASERRAAKLELFSSAISACARGRQHRTGGYEFKWGEPNEPALLPNEEWAELTDADLARARTPLSGTRNDHDKP